MCMVLYERTCTSIFCLFLHNLRFTLPSWPRSGGRSLRRRAALRGRAGGACVRHDGHVGAAAVLHLRVLDVRDAHPHRYLRRDQHRDVLLPALLRGLPLVRLSTITASFRSFMCREQHRSAIGNKARSPQNTNVLQQTILLLNRHRLRAVLGVIECQPTRISPDAGRFVNHPVSRGEGHLRPVADSRDRSMPFSWPRDFLILYI